MSRDSETRRALLRRFASAGAVGALSAFAGCQGNETDTERETVDPPSPSGDGSAPIFPTREGGGTAREAAAPAGPLGGVEVSISATPDDRSDNPMIAGDRAEASRQVNVDFRGLNWSRRTELQTVFDRTDRDWERWLDTLLDDDTFTRSRELGVFLFQRPRMDSGERYDGFRGDVFQAQDTVLGALDHLHSYLMGFAALGTDQQVGTSNSYRDPAVAPRPGDSWAFAPVLQEAFSRYTDHDVEFWPVPMYQRKRGGTYTFPRFVQRGGLFDVERVPFARRSEDNRYWAMMGYDRQTGDRLLVDGIYRPEWFNRQHYRHSKIRVASGEWPDDLYAHELLTAVSREAPVDSEGAFGPDPIELDVRPRSTHNTIETSPYVPRLETLQDELQAIDARRRESCDTDACRDRDVMDMAVVDSLRELGTLSAATDYWAPPRYDGRTPPVEGLDHQTAAELVLAGFVYQVGSPQAGNVPDIGRDTGLVADPAYLTSIAQQWRGERQFVSRQHAREQAWILRSFAVSQDRLRIRGTLADPTLLTVSPEAYDRAWAQYGG